MMAPPPCFTGNNIYCILCFFKMSGLFLYKKVKFFLLMRVWRSFERLLSKGENLDLHILASLTSFPGKLSHRETRLDLRPFWTELTIQEMTARNYFIQVLYLSKFQVLRGIFCFCHPFYFKRFVFVEIIGLNEPEMIVLLFVINIKQDWRLWGKKLFTSLGEKLL